jgi:hypothetical protein
MALEKNKTEPWKHVFQVTDYFWLRNNGADHIFVMPAPVTNLRHESNRRGFFHYMIQLNSPIFLHLEYSGAFYNEYPICAKQKNIMMPYPSIDPKMIETNYDVDIHTHEDVTHNNTRELLLYYIGGNHGECMEIRKHLNRIVKHMNTDVIPMHHRHRGYLHAIFCPVPVGDSPSSKRMYDAMNLGCIPVILSDDLIYAYSLSAGGKYDPNLFSITLPQKVWGGVK